MARRDWRSGGPQFKSHPRLTSQSWSSYQLNQLGSKAASDSTLKQLTTCGVSNTLTVLLLYRNKIGMNEHLVKWIVNWEFILNTKACMEHQIMLFCAIQLNTTEQYWTNSTKYEGILVTQNNYHHHHHFNIHFLPRLIKGMDGRLTTNYVMIMLHTKKTCSTAIHSF